MTDVCVCCSEAQGEYLFTWQEPSEHRKDQIDLAVKLGLPLAAVFAVIATFNYYVWKKR